MNSKGHKSTHQLYTPPNGSVMDSALVDAVDEILLSTEPYHFTETHTNALENQLGKPVRLVDGERLSWYGSRAIAGLAYLRELSGGR